MRRHSFVEFERIVSKHLVKKKYERSKSLLFFATWLKPMVNLQAKAEENETHACVGDLLTFGVPCLLVFRWPSPIYSHQTFSPLANHPSSAPFLRQARQSLTLFVDRSEQALALSQSNTIQQATVATFAACLVVKS